MLSWVRDIFGFTLEATRQGVTYIEKKAKPKLIDVTEVAFLADKAREMNIAMKKLLHNHSLERQRAALKRKVRRRVKGSLLHTFDSEAVVDEVTERITDVAAYDPFYKKWFV